MLRGSPLQTWQTATRKVGRTKCNRCVLGKSLQSDEHYIGTTDGIMRCRSIWRRAENRRWSLEHLDKMKGSPWQPRGVPTVMPGTPGGVVAPGTLGGNDRFCINLGPPNPSRTTPGCPGCSCSVEDQKPHNKNGGQVRRTDWPREI